MRWDYFGNPREATNKQENFLFGSGPIGWERVANGKAAVVPNLYANARHDNFSPRIGFAWNPTEKLVLRGGFGTFYDRPSNQIYTNNRANMPLFAVPTFGVPTGTPVNYGYCTPTSTYNVSCPENPLASEVSVSSAGGLIVPINGVETPIPTEQYGTTQQFPVAYSENWNLGVQYALTPSLVAEVDYIGDTSFHNYLSTDINRVDRDVNPATGLVTRPNINFADIQLSQRSGNSNFNALSIGLRRNAAKGVTLSGYYTWSHASDYCSNYLQGSCTIPEIYDIRANYGPSDFDVHHHLAGYAVWEVPNIMASTSVANSPLQSLEVERRGERFSPECPSPQLARTGFSTTAR